MMTTKGQSMTLSYWRERAESFEKSSAFLYDRLYEQECRLTKQKRLAGNQRSQKNYWKRKAGKLERDLDEKESSLRGAVLAFAGIHRELDKQKLLAIWSNFAFYAQLALWIIWS